MMQKAVNNLTDSPITLGGVEVDSKGQRIVRESLISADEKKAITDSGAVINFGHKAITVSVKTDADAELEAKEKAEAEAKAKAEAGTKAEDEAKANSESSKKGTAFTHLDVAYPAELIKGDGTTNGSAKFKAKIEALKEQYGETILDDKTFTEKYPDADIETYRVKVGE